MLIGGCTLHYSREEIDIDLTLLNLDPYCIKISF